MAKKKAAAKSADKDTAAKTQHVSIKAPNLITTEFTIVGDSPYVQNKFSAKAKQQIHDTQTQGSTAKKGKQREPKDFKACYEGAMYKAASGGWHGIPAPAFRNACISACKIVGFAMTRAKLSVFTLADGYDAEDGTPLVRITKGEPTYHEAAVRPEKGGCDIRPRPMWR